jgi:hypothetical protein
MRRIIGWSCSAVLGTALLVGIFHPIYADDYSVDVNLVAWVIYIGLFWVALWGFYE